MRSTGQCAVLGVMGGVILSCAQMAAQPALSWSQPPGFLVYTNDPGGHGGSHASALDWNQAQATHTAVADDFVADAYRIMRLRWWGSYAPGYERFEEAFVISFFLDHANRPIALAGTYIAPTNAVSVAPTPFNDANGQQIFEYEVELNQTCLDYEGFLDAEPGGFHGNAGRRYWLSIQAAVGRHYTSNTNERGFLECSWEQTSKTATNFWGWHTSPTNRAATSVSGDSQLSGTNLVFSNWHTNFPVDAQLGQAFQNFSGCDPDPPRLVRATGYCAANLVELVYDKKVDSYSGNDEFNYVIFRDDFTTVLEVIDAHTIGRSVWLVLDPEIPLACEGVFMVRVQGVKDLCGNALETDTVPLTCIPCPPQVSGLCPPISVRLERKGPYLVLVWDSPNYILEATTSLSSPWFPVTSQSPFVLWSTARDGFFRLRCLNSPTVSSN